MCLLRCQLGFSEKSAASTSFPSTIGYIYIFMGKIWLSFLTSGQAVPALNFSLHDNVSIPALPLWAFNGLTPARPCFSSTEEPNTDPNSPDAPYQCWMKEKDHLIPEKRQPSLPQGHITDLWSTFGQPELPELSSQAVFSAGQPLVCQGFFLPRCKGASSLATSLSLTSWGSCKPMPPSCQGPFNQYLVNGFDKISYIGTQM